MKKLALLLLSLCFVFLSCESDDNITVTPPLTSDDGEFALLSATVGYNTDSSISNLNPTGGIGNNVTYGVDTMYLNIGLDRLETGTNPEIKFTFDKNLYSDTFEYSKDEAVYPVTEWSGTAIVGISTAPRLGDNVFYDVNGPLPVTDFTVIGPTVTFIFEPGTFKAGQKVIVTFGVKNTDGEAYQVTTAFTPIADVKESVTITSNFSDYYAYAVDTDKVIYLNPGSDPDEHTAAIGEEKITGLTPAPVAGNDFGSRINTLDLRYLGATSAIPREYGSLKDLQTANKDVFYKLTHSDAENATYYKYYIKDTDDDPIDKDSTPLTVNYVLGTTTDEVNIGYEYDDEDNKKWNVELNLDKNNIKEGYSLVVIPGNSRGLFFEYASEFEIKDSVRPYSTSLIDIAATITPTWPGANYAALNHEHVGDAAIEGHAIHFTTVNVAALGGYSKNDNEVISVTVDSVDLAPDVSTVTGALAKTVTRDQVMEVVPTITPLLYIDEDDLVSHNGGLIWTYAHGTDIEIFAGINCMYNNAGTDTAINYPATNLLGKLKLTLTDLSGNLFMYKDAATPAVLHETGKMTLEFK